MSERILNLLEPAAVRLHLEAQDKAEVITELGTQLFNTGYVRDSFVQAALQREAERQREAWQTRLAGQLADVRLAAVTRDGRKVEVVANIGGLADAEQAVKFGAEGVGLLRTEFLYLDNLRLPTIAEQVQVYRQIFQVIGSRPLVVRSLDIGDDKTVEYPGTRQEPNPFLGWRAIRMIDEKPELLRDQFNALLQAGVGYDLRIMVPMVSSLEEVVQARRLLDEARQSLRAQSAAYADGSAYAEQVQFGIMVEVPSAALLAEHLAGLVDFFSIGTNDLAQYTLAVDRTNERVAHLASPFHPAVIRLIDRTIRSAHAKGKWVGLCGEMAGDPLATPLLLGLGLDEFSMAAAAIPEVKARIRQLDAQACQGIAARALELPTARAVTEYLQGIRV